MAPKAAAPPAKTISMEPERQCSAATFAHPETFLGKAIEIAGDALTPLEIVERVERTTGKATHFVELPLEQLRSFDVETAIMYDWFNQSGYQADIPTLRQLHPGLLTFDAWLQNVHF